MKQKIKSINLKQLLVSRLFHKHEKPYQQYLKFISIVLVSFIFSWFLFRQLPLWLLSRAIVGQVSPISSYDPIELKNELQNQSQSILLIDIRSRADYYRGHLKTAVNLPWKQNLGDWMKKLNSQKIKNKTLILYQYSAASTSPQELVVYLRKRGLAAYYLAIGYNEWRHFHTFWLPDREWGTWQVERFIEE